jgi:hypothetical protein
LLASCGSLNLGANAFSISFNFSLFGVWSFALSKSSPTARAGLPLIKLLIGNVHFACDFGVLIDEDEDEEEDEDKAVEDDDDISENVRSYVVMQVSENR